VSWGDAEVACEAMGGYLASIGSPEERDLITANTVSDTWIGAREGGFTDDTVSWEAPSLACLTDWAPNQPESGSSNCVEIYDNGQWDDRPCAELNYYVCEREP
jgi:hypothetical protein